MKNGIKFLGILLLASGMCVVSLSCNKDKDKKQGVLNITAINDNTSQVVYMELKSANSPVEKGKISIDCYEMSSAIFDVRTQTFGYMDCYSNYRFIDVAAGKEIKRFSLPESISFVIVDTIRNLLIGHYYINGTEKDNGTDHVLIVDLNNGNIVSDRQFYVGGAWDGTTWFFRDIENEYVLVRRDWTTDENELVFINPSTGTIIRTLSLGTDVGNGVYDRKNNRLIGTTYSNETSKNYIVTIDLSTGRTLNKVVAQGLGGYSGEEMDYDVETNSYILVSSNNEVLFFDVETGKLNEKYQLDFEVTSLKIWRSRK